nr:class II glutamine amidotransferase [uncultured Cohaesibacter sp.]
MCRWVAYKGQPVFLEHYVTTADHSLIHQSLHAERGKTVTNGDGFGIGWYGAKEKPGIYREILPAWNDSNLKSLAAQIQSPLFFAHVRASTGTATNRCNCHPFAYKKWMFMHNGQIGQYEKVRRCLEAQLSDEYYEHRYGSTDSELLFLLAMQEDLQDCPVKAMRSVLNRVYKAMTQKGITTALRFTSCLSDGKRLCGFRCSTDDLAPSLYYRRYENGDVVLVSEPIDRQSECWVEVPQHYAVCFKEDGDMVMTEMEIQLPN